MKKMTNNRCRLNIKNKELSKSTCFLLLEQQLKFIFSQLINFLTKYSHSQTQPHTKLISFPKKCSILSQKIRRLDYHLQVVELPLNIPQLRQKQIYFFYTQSNLSNSDQFKLPIIPGENNYRPNSIYWKVNLYKKNNNFISLPYIPFFSNCNSFGKMIYFTELLKDKKFCTILDENQVQPINQIKFISKPKADICQNIQLKCIYDQDLNQVISNVWFKQHYKSVIMYITKEFISSQQFKFFKEYQKEKLVPVTIISDNQQNNKIPTAVIFQIRYYQIDKTTKRILKSNIQLKQWKQYNSNDTIFYNLEIKYIPMSHTQILIAFGFDWYVYLISYLIFGIVTNIQIGIFTIYNKITNRRKIKPPFKPLLTLTGILNVAIGAGLALFLVFIVLLIIQMLTLGQFLFFNIPIFECSKKKCPISIFYIFNSSYQIQQNESFKNCGIAFFSVGLYFILRTSEFFLNVGLKQNQKKKITKIEINGLSFSPLFWRKGQFLITNLVFLCLFMFLIFLSLSNYYANNVWMFLALSKLIAMVLEQITQIYFQEHLPKLALKIPTDLVIYLNGLAAPDFFSFLTNFLIDTNYSTLEKTYVFVLWKEIMQKFKMIIDFLNEKIKKMCDDFVEQQKIQKQQKVSFNQEDKKKNNQNVNLFSYDLIHQISLDEITQLSNSTEDNQLNQDQFEHLFKNILDSKLSKSTNQIYNVQKKKQAHDSNSSQTLKLQMYNECLTTIYLYMLNPILILILWIFYDQNQILQSYIITQSTVIYFFLSGLVFILFAIFNNICYLHVGENFLGLDLTSYVNKVNQRFKNRMTFWKAHQDEINIRIEKIYYGTDRYCFSSQFFFILTIFAFANLLVVIGIFTFYKWNFNPLIYDEFSIMFLTWMIGCYCFEKLVICISKKLNIWKYKDFLQNRRVSPEMSQDFFIYKENNNLNQTSLESNHELQYTRRYKLKNLNYILKYRTQKNKYQMFAKNLIDNKKYNKQSFKIKYIHTHKKWLNQNLKLIFLDIDLHQKKLVIQFLCLRFYLWLDIQSQKVQYFKNIKKIKAKPNLKDLNIGFSIFKSWKTLTKEFNVAKDYVGILLQRVSKPPCNFCFNQWGVKSLMNNSMIQIYQRFILQNNIEILNSSKEIEKWQIYFFKHMKHSQLCLKCHMLLRQ